MLEPSQQAAPSPRSPLTLSPTRQQLLSWFRAEAVPLADAYEGAIHLLADGAFPGRIHFIAHAVRDIADRLVYVLDPQLENRRVQYEDSLDQIMKEWPDVPGVGQHAASASQAEAVLIDYRVAKRIDSLVRDHRDRRQRPSHYELLFRYLMRNEPFQATVNRRLVEQFKGMHRWFMERTHLRSNCSPQVDEEELQNQFRRFEGMLHSFVGDFFTGTADLDDILRQANQRSD
jgi:hypothetical protein